MKRLAVALILLAIEPAIAAAPSRENAFTVTTPSLSFANPNRCSFAAIMADDSVIIDWSCVKIQAAEYKARRDRSSSSAFAFVLEALRNGTAIVK